MKQLFGGKVTGAVRSAILSVLTTAVQALVEGDAEEAEAIEEGTGTVVSVLNAVVGLLQEEDVNPSTKAKSRYSSTGSVSYVSSYSNSMAIDGPRYALQLLSNGFDAHR